MVCMLNSSQVQLLPVHDPPIGEGMCEFRRNSIIILARECNILSKREALWLMYAYISDRLSHRNKM